MAFNFSPKIVTNGLVLHLDAANPKSYTSGSTIWRDLTKNENHATIVNSPSFSRTHGGIFTFDGINDHMTIPSTATLTTTTPTVIVGCSPGNGVIIAKGRFGVYWNYGIVDVTTTQFEARNNNIDMVSPSFTSQSGMNVYAAAWTGTVVNFYRNGFFGGSNNTSYSPIATNSLFLTIGTAETQATPVTRSGFYNGSLSFILVYNRTLNDQEIQQNFNAYKGRYGL